MVNLPKDITLIGSSWCSAWSGEDNECQWRKTLEVIRESFHERGENVHYRRHINFVIELRPVNEWFTDHALLTATRIYNVGDKRLLLRRWSALTYLKIDDEYSHNNQWYTTKDSTSNTKEVGTRTVPTQVALIFKKGIGIRLEIDHFQ